MVILRLYGIQSMYFKLTTFLSIGIVMRLTDPDGNFKCFKEHELSRAKSHVFRFTSFCILQFENQCVPEINEYENHSWHKTSQ